MLNYRGSWFFGSGLHFWNFCSFGEKDIFDKCCLQSSISRKLSGTYRPNLIAEKVAHVSHPLFIEPFGSIQGNASKNLLWL